MTASSICSQELALSGIILGAVLCLIGAGAPFWVINSGENYGLSSEYISFNFGLWMYCARSTIVQNLTEFTKHEVQDHSCEIFDTSESRSWFLGIRVCASLCVLLGSISGPVALCMACCCHDSNTVSIGIACFIAGVSGIAAASMFIIKYEEVVISIPVLKIKFGNLGGALAVFCAGSGLLVMASFIECFAYSRSRLRPSVVSHNVSNTFA